MPGEPDRRETIYVLLVGVILALVTALPYALGAVLSSPEMEFSGFVIGLEDGNSYLAKMLQGGQGKWLFNLVYTSEPHQGGLFFLFYLVLGKIARLMGLSQALLLHLSRMLTIPFALYSFYRLVAYFSPRPAVRRMAVLLFAFAGGLGWLWSVLGMSTELGLMPVDLWVPEASFFLSALTFPHLTLKQGLLFWFILSALRFMDDGRPGDGVVAAFSGLGCSLIHPYTLPVIGVPLGIYALWCGRRNWKTLWTNVVRLALVMLLSVPYLIYGYCFFRTNPVFSAWQVQSPVYSPAPYLYLLGFGIPLVLAILGLVLHDDEVRVHPFLWIWLLMVPLLLYLPTPGQRRFLDGYQALIALLAARGMYLLFFRDGHRRWRTLVVAALLVPIVLTSALLLLGATLTAAVPGEPVYRPGWEMDAARWFWRDPEYPAVLSSYETGNLLPVHAPLRSFVGHGAETVNSKEKVRMVRDFFAEGTSDAWRQDLLERYGVDYIYHGPREKALGGFEPGRAAYFGLTYDNGEVQIYQVKGDK